MILDVVSVALATGGIATTLAAVKTWLQSRKDRHVTVRVEGPNMKLTLDATKMSADEIQQIVRDLTTEVEVHSPEDSEPLTGNTPD
jgi:hypothetical protein